MSAGRLQEVIGDTTKFLDAVFAGLSELGVDVSRYLCDHVCYRVATKEEYEKKKKELAHLGSLLVESPIGGRPIATFKLREPLQYGYRRIPLVELPAPKEGSPYATGLEHAEFVIEEPFDSFIKRHPRVKFNTSGSKKPRNADIEVQLGDDRKLSVKFHHQTLESVIGQEKSEATRDASKAAAGKRDTAAMMNGKEKEDIHDFRGGLVAAANHIVFERMQAKVLFLHDVYTVRL